MAHAKIGKVSFDQNNWAEYLALTDRRIVRLLIRQVSPVPRQELRLHDGQHVRDKGAELGLPGLVAPLAQVDVRDVEEPAEFAILGVLIYAGLDSEDAHSEAHEEM